MGTSETEGAVVTREPGGVTVRRAGVDDAAGIAAVHVASWQQGYRGLLPADLLDGLSVAGRTRSWTTNLTTPLVPGAVTLVAELAGEVVGFASVGPARDADTPGAGELWSLYVDPGHWGDGYGRVLHAHAVRTLAGTGVDEATLWVLTTNQRARGFYEHHGWVADGTEKVVQLGEVPLHETRYRLPGVRALARSGDLDGLGQGPGATVLS